MLSNLTELLKERAKRAPGEAKQMALNTVHDCFNTIKGSGTIREEIGKQINTLKRAPLEAGGTILTAANQLLHIHPIQATKTTAAGFIEASKNLAKLGVAPISGAMTVVKSGLSTSRKILSAPSNFAVHAFHSAQKTNEKLFALTDKFTEWNKLKPTTPVATKNETPATEAPVGETSKRKVPALMQVPGAPTEPITDTEKAESIEDELAQETNSDKRQTPPTAMAA